MQASNTKATPVLVALAFLTVYLVWGSTYLFIQLAVHEIPALMMGAIRFIIAGLLLMGWCIYKQERIFNWQQMKPAIITGLLLLLVGNGAVIWAEKTLPSSLVAVLVSSAPLWFVVLDKPKWKENLSSRSTLVGLAIGFLGVLLLFWEQAARVVSGTLGSAALVALLVLMVGSISWAGGSIYNKYNSKGSATVSSAWQMLAAGIAFTLGSGITGEWRGFEPAAVSNTAWWSIAYLITFGSLAGYSAYVWLLKVRPVTQVSTYAYVNPVVAVLLGVLFAGETMSALQVTGLAVILGSVLLINLAKYRKTHPVKDETGSGEKELVGSDESALQTITEKSERYSIWRKNPPADKGFQKGNNDLVPCLDEAEIY
ncbi:EamA family transporter [Flavihumibacter sediminis]|nr:EamA family transporter [Flavihumibacter sediminis]